MFFELLLHKIYKNSKYSQIMVTEEQVREALKQCYDPELNMDIITLELVYGIEVKYNNVKIRMTFTTPACPYGPLLLDEIQRKVKEALPEIKDLKIDVVFDPPWQPSDELRAIFGI